MRPLTLANDGVECPECGLKCRRLEAHMKTLRHAVGMAQKLRKQLRNEGWVLAETTWRFVEKFPEAPQRREVTAVYNGKAVEQLWIRPWVKLIAGKRNVEGGVLALALRCRLMEEVLLDEEGLRAMEAAWVLGGSGSIREIFSQFFLGVLS